MILTITADHLRELDHLRNIAARRGYGVGFAGVYLTVGEARYYISLTTEPLTEVVGTFIDAARRLRELEDRSGEAAAPAEGEPRSNP